MAVADHQTAGRGRLGRRWEAPPGANLLCSILLRPDVVSWLAVARVSLAAREAVHAVAGVDAGLKWPNDLVVDIAGESRKLAGVLAEVDGGAVVVGIGINVAWAPPDLPAICLGEEVSRDAVLDSMLAALTRWLDRPDADVASAYRTACVTIDRAVRVELPDEVVAGTASDITADGHLLVDTGVCLREISAGDVVHVR